jgi:hypothetical protein
VESCSPVPNDGASDTSSLSEPATERPVFPDHLLTTDAGNDDDDIAPYENGQYTLYPELTIPDDPEDPDGTPNEESKIRLRKITDATKFADAFEDMEDMSYNKLYHIVVNAQNALVAWQNEWIDLERTISTTQEPPIFTTDAQIDAYLEKSKPKNPRIPKNLRPLLDSEARERELQKYEDMKEALVYGYAHNPKREPGRQNPLELTIGRLDGRELRPKREQTQKAIDAGFSMTPESEDEPERGRGMRNRNQSIRAQSSVVASRDQTPVATFPSGKKIGRPRKNPQPQGKPAPSRLRELQAEFGNSPLASNSPRAEEEDDDRDVPRQSTEGWGMESNPNSRPTTSSTNASSFDMNSPAAQNSGKGKRRQNTSDFEDGRPNKKRAKQQKTNGVEGHGESAEKEGSFTDGVPGNSRSEKMRHIQKQSWAKDDGSRRANLKSGMRERWEVAKAEGRKTLGPSLSASKKGDTSVKAKKDPKTKEDGKPSAASLNMLNRWAKKREAIAAGLPAPNIGRYAKEKSASTAPNGTGTPEQSNLRAGGSSVNASSGSNGNPFAYEMVGFNNNGISTTPVDPPPKKKGGRPRKVVPSEPVHAPIKDDAQDQQQISEIPQYDPESGSAPKRVVKRTKKASDNDADAASLMETIEGGMQPPTTVPRVGRRRKDEGATPSTASSNQTHQSTESDGVRRSGRAAKPSARSLSAASSYVSGSRSAQNTVTPTPAPNGTSAGSGSMQQFSNAEHMPAPKVKGKRGRPATVLQSTESGADDGVDDGQEPPTKKRRTKNNETTPEETSAQRMSRKTSRNDGSSSVSSASGGAIVVEDKVPNVAYEEYKKKGKGRGRPPSRTRRPGFDGDANEGLGGDAGRPVSNDLAALEQAAARARSKSEKNSASMKSKSLIQSPVLRMRINIFSALGEW